MILPRKNNGADILTVNLYVRREMVNRNNTSQCWHSKYTGAAREDLKGCA